LLSFGKGSSFFFNSDLNAYTNKNFLKMKKFTFLMAACLLGLAANAQTWNSFGSKGEGTPPEIV
jgi:hypothetical protein